MLRQKEYEVFLKDFPPELCFKVIDEDKVVLAKSLTQMNKEGKRLVQVIDIVEARTETKKKIAIFEYDEKDTMK